MSELVSGILFMLIYGFILILMITVTYKKTVKRKHVAKQKNRLKLIKGEKVGK